ncbi:MAG: hypothetical protein POG74_10710 [Acidocella sp.]|nr:hypothetical protein [Acidocella sp.]
MRFSLLSIMGLVVFLNGCAQSPETIQPAYVSPVTYQNWSCEQLSQEEINLANAYATAAAEQSQARTADTWGVILIGVPTASLSGENIAPQVANIKGQQQAVRQSEISKNCATSAPKTP